jgi:hypothetical protein
MIAVSSGGSKVSGSIILRFFFYSLAITLVEAKFADAQTSPKEPKESASAVAGSVSNDALKSAAEGASKTAPVVLRLRTVEFVVRAKGSGLYLRRVEVTHKGNTLAYTDKQGRVSVTTGAKYVVELKRFGYDRLEVKLADLPESKKTFEFFIQPAAPSDNEVLVVGNRRPEVSRKVISVREASRISPSGDPIQVTKFMPGVQSQGFSPKVVIRGSGPNDSGYYIDDIEIPDIFHRIGNISVLPEGLTNEVEFSSGGFGAQRGDRHGGMITLRTTSELPERAKTEARINLPIYSGLFHETPIGDDASLAVSVRRSYVDSFINALVMEGSLTVVPAFGDGHIRYLKKRDNGFEKLWLVGSYDSLKLATALPNGGDDDGRGTFDIMTSFGLLGYEIMRSLGGGWSLSITPNLLYATQDIKIVGNTIDIKNLYKRVYGEARKRLSKNAASYVGAEISHVQSKVAYNALVFDSSDPFFDVEEAEVLRLDRVFNNYKVAVWVQHDFELQSLILSPGMRAYFNSQIKTSMADPRLALRWLINEQHQLKIATGQYSQSPESREAADGLGNPDLEFERSLHYVAGHEWKPSEQWSFDVQMFYKKTFDIIVGDSNLRYVNTGDRRTRGYELFIRRNPTDKWFAWLSYTYSKTEERDSEKTGFHPGRNDQTQVINLAGDYSFNARWTLGGVTSYHTGDTRTPVIDAFYDANGDKYTPISDELHPFSDRLPNFYQIDIYATYRWYFDLWKLSWKFGFQYLAFSPQAIDLQYSYDYEDKEFFTGLPPIPFVEFKGVF